MSEKLSEENRALVERTFPDESFGSGHGWVLTSSDLNRLLNAARAEARPTVDREAVAGPAYTSVGYQYRFSDPMSGYPVWRTSSAQWNGQRPQETREIFALLSPATSPGDGSSSANRAARIASDHAASETPVSAGRCATCRHFHPDRLGFGSCDRWKQGYGTSVEDLRRDEALVENDEGWGMIVGPLFGCVLHGTPTPDDAGGGG